MRENKGPGLSSGNVRLVQWCAEHYGIISVDYKKIYEQNI